MTALSPSVSVKSLLLTDRGDRDPALKVTDVGRSQLGTTVELSVKGIAFQNTTPLTDVLSKPLMHRLDLLIILVKQYIYACKCSEKEPILNEFVKKVNVQWKIENCTLP